MPPAKSKGNTFHKRRRRPLTHVKSGIALSTLALPTPLPAKLGGPLKRGRSKSSLTRMNSKGIEMNAMGDAGKGKKPTEEVVVAKESFITSRTARVLLAGAGFLADAYDLFIINLVLRLLKDEYPQYAMSGQLHLLEGSVASAALVGSIFGQLVAGSMADIIGRKRIFVATAALITIGCIGSACALDTPSLTIYGQIACWRTLLGAGVGGEYPLAATVTSESSSAGKRGSLMSAVFAMQGVGSLLSGCVVFVCLFLKCSTAFTWRFALAFGALPVMIAFPYRLRMHETESFSRLQQERANVKAHNTKTKAQQQEKHKQQKQLSRSKGTTSTDRPRVLKADHEIMHVEEGIPLFSPMLTNQPYYQSLNDTKPDSTKKHNSKTNDNNTSAGNSPLVPLSGNMGKLQIRNNELIGTDTQMGAFVTTEDGQVFFHHSESHSPGTNNNNNANNNNNNSNNEGDYLPTSMSSSLRPSTNNTSTNNNNHHNGSSKSNSNSSLVKKVSDTALAAVSALPPAKKAELISVFHRPVTPSSSPVQTITGQYMAAQLEQHQQQQQQNQQNTADRSKHNSNDPNNGSILVVQETEAPPVTTMMDVFRQFHRYRTNSADLTDDYGLYHIDSRHNSSNYSQTMMHMMSSSYSNNNPPSLQSIQQQQSVQTMSPHTQATNNNNNNTINSDQFMATPMFAKVKSRGLLSKSPALASSNTNSSNSPTSPLPSTTSGYPAPASSLISQTNNIHAISTTKRSSSTTTSNSTVSSTTNVVTSKQQQNKQRRYSHERPPAPYRRTPSSMQKTASQDHHRHSYDLLNEEELLEDGEEILEIALQDTSADDHHKHRHRNHKATSKPQKKHRRKRKESSTNEEEEGNDEEEEDQDEDEEDVAGFSDNDSMSDTDENMDKDVQTCCGSSRFAETWRVFVIYRYHILGTALSWFLLDVVFYANGLFNHEVTSHIFSSANNKNNNGETSLLSPPSLLNDNNPFEPHHISARYLSADSIYHPYSSEKEHLLNLHSPYGKAVSYLSMSLLSWGTSVLANNDTTDISIPTTSTSSPVVTTPVFSKTSAQEDAFHSIILSSIAIPGYILAVLYLEKVGRKRLQMTGFFIMAMLFMICAVGYDYMLSDDPGGDKNNMWGKYMFLVIYALTFLFSNFGPNTTTFVIPGEIYPAEVRATCHGLSAASGKLGAAAGAYFFPMILSYHQSESNSKTGMQRAMAMCAFVALLGVLVTHFFIPKYDSNTLALADARFEETEECEEGEEEVEEGEEQQPQEEAEEEEVDEETGLKPKKPVKKPTSSNLKLIVIALEHDCLLTVKEDDARYKDICLIRHEEDVYCEDIDDKGQRHRHYSGHSAQYHNTKTFSNSSCENIPYQAIRNDAELDGSSSGNGLHAPPPLPWTRLTAPSSSSTSTSTAPAATSTLSTVNNSHNITNKPTNISSGPPLMKPTTQEEETKQRQADIENDDEDNDNDSINSDMSDSELYRRLEAARMQYEIRERESAASACL